MKFHILGPLEITAGDGATALRGVKQRVLLAVLLCRANRPVGTATLADALWPGAWPASAEVNLRGYVHQLRQVLDPGRLSHAAGGYRLGVQDGELDAAVFTDLAARGLGALADGQPGIGAGLLRQALAQWRGPAFAGLPRVSLLHDEGVALEELRMAVLEERIGTDLAAGRHTSVIGELRGLLPAHPFRERFGAQLMLALYRAGRQADALQVFHDFRARLAGELGIEPGPELRRLYLAVLKADAAIDLPAPAAPLRAAASPNSGQPADPAPGHLAAGAVPGHAAGEASSRAFVATRPAQLPADASCFTGRAGYLRELDTLAAESRRSGTGPVIVLLTGMAGVGKTALAVRWARRAAPQFEDGQLYVQLRACSPGPRLEPQQALAQMLRALGPGSAGPASPADPGETAAAFRSVVAGRRLLIVLDDAASADQVRPLLPGSERCMVIITSRNRMTGLVAREGAHRICLAPLHLREATRLLRRTIGTAPSGDCAQIAELARLCGCLPLALRIAAADLAGSAIGGLAERTRQLANADRLAALRAESDEQASVSAAFECSYRRLSEPGRRLFRLLGMAPGPDISAASAACLAGLPAAGVSATLAELSAACLINEHHPGRYELHDLVKLYAAQRGACEDSTAERQAATRRLARWYLAHARAAGDQLYPHLLRMPAEPAPGSQPPGPGPALFPGGPLAWLDAERANLIAMVVHCAGNHAAPLACRLTDALRGYFANGRHLTDWLVAGRAAIRAAASCDEPAMRAASLLGLGHALWCLGRYPEARTHYRLAIVEARRAHWTEAQATIVGNIGLIDREIGEPERAIRYLRLAVALDRRTDRLHGLANNLANLGCVLTQVGEPEQARSACEEALRHFRDSGARLGEAHALANLGAALREMGQLDAATEALQAALAIYRDTGDRSNEADTLNSLAAAQRDAGHYGTALELVAQARKLAARAGDQRAQADSLITAASIYQLMSQHQQVMRYDRKALRLSRHTGIRYQQTQAEAGLALAVKRLS